VRAVLVGIGAVGRRVAQHLVADDSVESVVIQHRDPTRAASIVEQLGAKVELRRGAPSDIPPADLTVVSIPTGARRVAEAALAGGSHVVSTADDPHEIRALISLDAWARGRDRGVVVGAAMAPGLSCVLAAYMYRGLDSVDEVHVASVGTGGPACARRHHAALTSPAVDWEEGDWRRRPGGSGRELVWFPEPVGGADCYRAGLADALLLVPAFPDCRRLTSRLGATRRDRMTSWLPMLRPPHPEGLSGAVRVEVRGWLDSRAETRIMGAAAAPAVVAAAVAAMAGRWAGTGRLARTGAGGLAELIGEPGRFLKDLAGTGVTVAEFAGRDVEATAS
jgi:saccharopine dehydrogenase-like NADP-dependent oxidoreductase